MSVSKIGFLSALALSALLVAIAHDAQAATVVWNGSSSNDLTLGTNWSSTPNLPAAADTVQFSDAVSGLQHNLVMNSSLTPLARNINVMKDVTAPYTITGTGTLQLAATTTTSTMLNASDQPFTIDTAVFNMSRAALIRTGDYFGASVDHGTAPIIIGSPATAATMQFNLGDSSSSSTSQAVQFDTQFGTSITVYPTVNFPKATSSTRTFTLLPTTGGTISLLGGISGTTSTAARTVNVGGGTGFDGVPYDGTVVLGNSPGLMGNIFVRLGTLVINANNSLGPGDGTDGYTEMNRTGGALALSNNITTPAGEIIYFDTRLDYTPHLKNAGGVNTIAGIVELEQGSTTPLVENTWTMQASGSSSDELRFTGTIQSSAGELSSNPQILALTGTGKGTVLGSMIEQNAHAYSVEKYDGGTWTYATGSSINYTGTTHVLAGSLVVNGTHSGGGLYTVDSGATLAGSGSISASVNLSGNISPGNSPGTMTVGGLSLLNGSSANMEMQNTAGSHAPGGGLSDLIAVTGQLQIAAGNPTITINASAVGGGPLGTGAGGTWTLATYATSMVFSTPTFVINGIASGYSAAIDLSTPNQVNLVLTAVPEPSTFVLAGLGIVGLVAVRARKRK